MKIQAPILKTVDLIVIAGSSSAVQTAVDLRKKGFSIFLISPYTYLGEDFCAALNLYEVPESFGLGKSPTPAAVKLFLEKQLLESGADFLFQCFPLSIIEDSENNFAGLMVGNRSGMQIICAKAILDGSERELLAGLANLPQKPFRPGGREVSRIVMAEHIDEVEGFEINTLPCSYTVDDKEYKLFEMKTTCHLAGNSAAELAELETKMRRLSFQGQTVVSADQCRYQLNDGISISYSPSKKEPFFFTKMHNSEQIAQLLTELTQAKAEKIKQNSALVNKYDFELVNKLTWQRTKNNTTLEISLDKFPVSENCDVLVIGGGTAGAPAAIAAAREGAKTICLELNSDLGGVCTVGRIGSYYYGNRVGFCQEMDEGITALADNPKFPAEHQRKDTEWKRNWLLFEGEDCGVKYRFNTCVIAAAVRDNQVCGALICDNNGHCSIIKADFVIDASGNCDLAAPAGAEIAEESFEPVVQGAGLSPIIPNLDVTNNDYNFILDEDVFDTTRAFVQAHHKFAGHFDYAQMVNTRERRRIIGDIYLQPQDFYAYRKYSDTITIARSNFDTHGYIISPMFMLKAPTKDVFMVKVPLRAMIPVGLENLLVTGLGVSAHRDCIPVIRMQPDLHNQGYAAGLAAAMSAKTKKKIRDIKVKELQKKLVEIKIIDKEILTEEDGFDKLEKTDIYTELAEIFLNPEAALTKLQKKFEKEQDIFTAQILAFLGDSSGRDLLAQNISNTPWDEGWNYRGMHQFGPSMSELDCKLVALANLGDAETVFLQKLASLKTEDAFSHFRVISLIFMKYPKNSAIEKFEALLAAPGMSMHAHRTYQDAILSNREEVQDNSIRNAQLKEIYLAAALNACQPGNLLAQKSLLSYIDGLQGHYQKFALKAIQNA